MSNKIKVKRKTKKAKLEVAVNNAELTADETSQLDEIAERVRQSYAEENELKEKMLELAQVHVSAFDCSIDYWDREMGKAAEVIATGRTVYPGAWEGRLLWLERAAQVLNIDVARSTEYDDGTMSLYWSDVDGNIVLKDEVPEFKVESIDNLKSLQLLRHEGESSAEPVDDKG